MQLRWRRGAKIARVAAATALCTGALSACASGASGANSHAPIESVTAALRRVAPPVSKAAVHEVAEPAQYRIDYDVYFADHTRGDVAGHGKQQRRLLDATRTYRRVVRPFEESGSVQATLGFARGSGGAVSRVTPMRPLGDDPRPRIYPPPDPPVGYRRVAGRTCASYVVGDGEYCIDGAGLVLVSRTPLSLDVAVRVTTGGDAETPAQIAAPLAKGFTEPQRGSLRPIDPGSAPAGATDYALDAPPDGFNFVGRYAVVPLTGEVLNQTRKIVAGIADVYVRGVDAIVVERGGKLDKGTVGDESLGALQGKHDVDLGGLGAGQAGIAGVGPFGYREVRATPSQGRYVVVAGTVPEDELVTIAPSLQARPGSE
ncbi:MAG TPA: hypothetical protein VHD87_14655, partial [Acidimicrobiales bacterium]|nr:hypothetical protein [Acidimicrobiales bacterium]